MSAGTVTSGKPEIEIYPLKDTEEKPKVHSFQDSRPKDSAAWNVREILTAMHKANPVPVVFSRSIQIGVPLEERQYLMDAIRQPSYTILTSKMSLMDIFNSALKAIGIKSKSLAIASWNRDGSILMLKGNGSNISQFMGNLTEHNTYMEKKLGPSCWEDGELAALVMVEPQDIPQDDSSMDEQQVSHLDDDSKTN